MNSNDQESIIVSAFWNTGQRNVGNLVNTTENTVSPKSILLVQNSYETFLKFTISEPTTQQCLKMIKKQSVY